MPSTKSTLPEGRVRRIVATSRPVSCSKRRFDDCYPKMPYIYQSSLCLPLSACRTSPWKSEWRNEDNLPCLVVILIYLSSADDHNVGIDFSYGLDKVRTGVVPQVGWGGQVVDVESGDYWIYQKLLVNLGVEVVYGIFWKGDVKQFCT